MARPGKPHNTLIDYLSGRPLPDIGAEANRQAVARFLVEEKGYTKKEIVPDFHFTLNIAQERYEGFIDLAAACAGKIVMAVKCCAGSPGSREREILAAARLATDYQIPFAVVSDGRNATVLQTLTGKLVGRGLNAIPHRRRIPDLLAAYDFPPLAPERREREKLIFRSYDSMNVNVMRRPTL